MLTPTLSDGLQECQSILGPLHCYCVPRSYMWKTATVGAFKSENVPLSYIKRQVTSKHTADHNPLQARVPSQADPACRPR